MINNSIIYGEQLRVRIYEVLLYINDTIPLFYIFIVEQS